MEVAIYNPLNDFKERLQGLGSCLNCIVGAVYNGLSYDEDNNRWIFFFQSDLFKRNIRLYLNCPFQILSEGQVYVGSGDHFNKHLFPDTKCIAGRADVLSMNPIINAEVDGTGALIITFNSEQQLRTFADSSSILWTLSYCKEIELSGCGNGVVYDKYGHHFGLAPFNLQTEL